VKAIFDQTTQSLAVTLSERNLLALLAQLRDPDRPAPALFRAGLPSEDEPSILVQAQLDSEHYADRMGTPDEPIKMRARTEDIMDEIRDEMDPLGAIERQITEMFGFTLTREAVEEMFGDAYITQGYVREWGAGDTEVRGRISDEVTQTLIDQSTPTYGSMPDDRDVEDFYEKVKEAAEAKGWLISKGQETEGA
jgi:hypothetical protein